MMEQRKDGSVEAGCNLTWAHLDVAAIYQSLVILSAAKNLSTDCKLNFQTIARPFASLRVTDRRMAKTASRLAATIRWQRQNAPSWNESFIVRESNAAYKTHPSTLPTFPSSILPIFRRLTHANP